MSVPQTSDLQEASAACRQCGGQMHLARVDAYPMPRGRIEIQTLECVECRCKLQQVRANPDTA